MITIEVYSNEYAAAVAELFTAAVHAIDSSIYSVEQQQAWAPIPIDHYQWQARLSSERCYLALMGDQLLGFIELDGNDIDCCYVHPRFQAQGVATRLYQHIEAIAKQRGYEHLRVDASIVAKPFFEKHGFTQIRENQVARAGQTLTNFTLDKPLTI
ncbi:GNAT family N-acetyltransferase [Agarivorans sp. MS3-6]